MTELVVPLSKAPALIRDIWNGNPSGSQATDL